MDSLIDKLSALIEEVLEDIEDEDFDFKKSGWVIRANTVLRELKHESRSKSVKRNNKTS